MASYALGAKGAYSIISSIELIGQSNYIFAKKTLMTDKTLGQIKNQIPISSDTFKRWEKSGWIPKARRIKKGTTDTRVFNDEEVMEFVNVIKRKQDGELIEFDKNRHEQWSPFPLPNGRPLG